MLCFMCREWDPSHATAEVCCYFEQYYWLKSADLEAFAVPLAKNMEDKYCAGQTLQSIFNFYLMGIHAKKKTLGSFFAGITF